MKNKIVVVFSSHRSEEENNIFIKHINTTIGTKHNVVCYPNFNEFSLSEVYNKAILEYNAEDTIMVFCHNDIKIKTKNWGKILLRKFNNSEYSILGVAGSSFLPETGRWWDDRSKMMGIVEHTDGLKTWVSEYSPKEYGIKDAVIVDGLFIAVDCNNIEHQWDEEFKGFHFYDLGFCFPNYLDGCDIGVITDIRILHESVGQTNEVWEENRLQFIEKYKEELPIKHINDKLRVLISCQFFNNYTGSEICVYEFARELIKQNFEVTVIAQSIGDPILTKAKEAGINVYNIANAPNYVVNQEGQLQFYQNQADFDVLYLNHKPISDLVLKLYPNIPAVMHIHSEVIPTFEVPIIHPQVKKYLSIRDTVREYTKSFGIKNEDIINIDNPFDITRFNTNYKKIINNKEVTLFIGTLDHLRKEMLLAHIKICEENDQELWIIGKDSLGYLSELTKHKNVKYLGVKDNVETYIKQCDYTLGIFKGRSTIEGFLCDKPAWIYDVDNNGAILGKELVQVPDDIERYHSEVTTKKLVEVFKSVLEV